MPALLRVRALTPDETERLRQLAHSRTAPARRVERARIIWSAHQGQRVPAIAASLHLTPVTVRRWLVRFNADGLPGLEDAPRSGCPPTYTREQIGAVIATALTPPAQVPADPPLPFACWTMERLADYLQQQRGLPISRSRVGAVLHAEGLRWRSQERGFGVGISEQARLDPEFAQKRGPSSGSTASRSRPASSSA
jgi:transposase